MSIYKTIEVVTSGWVSVNTTGTPIGVGTVMKIQNQTVKGLKMVYSASKPTDEDFSGEVITNLTGYESSKITPAGAEECWLRVNTEGDFNLKVFVQEWTL